MTTLILSFLQSPTVLAIIGGIAALFGYGFYRERVGRSKERAKHAQERERARDIADEIDSDIGALPSGEARDELKKWGRK